MHRMTNSRPSLSPKRRWPPWPKRVLSAPRTRRAPPTPGHLDNVYYREAAVGALETLGFDPYIAIGRQGHHAPQAEVPEEPATAQERMAAKLRTPAGQALYTRRKVIVV